MDTVGSHEADCKIVQNRIIKLESEAGCKSNYNGIVMIEDKLLVTDFDACNLQIYNLHDAKLIYTSHRLESKPMDVLIMSKRKVAVCLSKATIIFLSLKSIDDLNQYKTLTVRPWFDRCFSAIKLSSNKLVVSGWKYNDAIFLWGIVSIKDGSLDSIHTICNSELGRTNMSIKNNILYISCWCPGSDSNGVYAYNIDKPHQNLFLYQHLQLKTPGSIMTDKDYVFVCDMNLNTIHQLANSGQLLTIHTVSSRLHGLFNDDTHGVIYTTSGFGSNEITVYKIEYLHQKGPPEEILKMDDRSIQLFEDSLKDGEETVHSIRVMVIGPMGVGKTTLVKRLLGEGVNISERHITEGIDVYVNCFDVSLSTGTWTRQTNGSEQDFRLQRITKVLNEQHIVKGNVANDQVKIPQEKENDRTEILEDSFAAVKGKDAEIQHSSKHDIDKDISSTTHQEQEPTSLQQEESTENQQQKHSSAVVQKTRAQSKTNTIAMMKLLKENSNKTESKGNNSRLTIYDFAGQYSFYTTHQTFLTRRAIYLLVSDVSCQVTDIIADECYFDSKGIIPCKVHELVEVWLNSVHSCALSPEAGSPPVILVGTHVDTLPRGETRGICERYFRDIRSYLRDKPTRFHLIDEDFAIDNTVVDSRLEDLQRKIVEVASQQPYWGEKIPARWLLLEQELMWLKADGKKVISREEVEEINKEGTVQIEKSEELDLFLSFHHETGTIIYFSTEILRENIILDPTLVIDATKSLINAHPDLPSLSTDIGTHSGIPTDSVLTQKWSDFKGKGILSSELIDAVWTKEMYPELHAHKDHMVLIMEQLNIIARPKAFSEIGVKTENYFLTPCMLRQESPRELISPEQDVLVTSTPVLCCVFTGKFLPPSIFHRLIAACVTRWPIAKGMETSENLIFCGCCVFNLDLFHRLIVHCMSHTVFVRITRLVDYELKTPDAKLCTRVRRFITLNLSRITSYLGKNLQYELHSWWSPSRRVSEDGSTAPFQMWYADEGHDTDDPIMQVHMNHARVCVALVTVCAKALREILLTHVPAPHRNIYQAILANKENLTNETQIRGGQWRRSLLNNHQCQVVFPDASGRYVASVDQFDITLLYILIRNVSTVCAPWLGWGEDPMEEPARDRCLGASVERIRSYRNQVGHSIGGAMFTQENFDDYWNKIDAVLVDIEQALGPQGYRAQLENQRRQVISVYEA